MVNYYKAEAVDYQKVLDDTMAVADILTSMVVDVLDLLDQARQRGDFVMFEGAQGTLLDIDHGTYPYVTSPTPLLVAWQPVRPGPALC